MARVGLTQIASNGISLGVDPAFQTVWFKAAWGSLVANGSDFSSGSLFSRERTEASDTLLKSGAKARAKTKVKPAMTATMKRRALKPKKPKPSSGRAGQEASRETLQETLQETSQETS
jgi:hypothetical protein